jgi:hypothetical protein
MSEHELLKEICDLIWYKLENNHNKQYIYFEHWEFRRSYYQECRCWENIEDEYEINVREIIFTPEFMDKLIKFVDNKTLLWPLRIKQDLWISLLSSLNNPTGYLANLLEIKN